MTHKKIEQYRQKLVKIQKDQYKAQFGEQDKKQGEEQNKKLDQVQKLRDLAVEVGASMYTLHTGKDANANFSELSDNIHKALQTASMIETCRIATRSWVISIIAALAAWAAVLVIFLTK